MAWLARLPRSTDSWGCPWFLVIVAVGSAGTTIFCFEDMPLLASTSAWLVGFVIGSRR